MRTLVIGDIHGALKSLEQVLNRARYNPDEDKLVFLGDYVDGWGESAELIEFLITLKETNDNIVFVRGNHDNWCQDWLNYGDTPYMWTTQGGQATLDSYVRTGHLVEKEHKDFFNELVDYYIDDNNNIFIHGGWAYIENDFPASAMWSVNAGREAKECHWDRSLLAGAIKAHTLKATFQATVQFNKVFLGHTSTQSHLPEKYGNLWIVDSGCGWRGKLTIMDIDTEEYWQSDYSKDLYPNEKGR